MVGYEKTLARLTRGHLTRPEPELWLMAADLLEENGRPLQARKWRSRALWLPALLQACETLEAEPPAVDRRPWYVRLLAPDGRPDWDPGEVAAVAGPFLVRFYWSYLSYRQGVRFRAYRQADLESSIQLFTQWKAGVVPVAPPRRVRKLIDVIDRLTALT